MNFLSNTLRILTVCLFSTFIAFNNVSLSQDLEVKWSNRMKYEDDSDGFFSSYLDVNNTFIYALYINNLNKTATGVISKMKIVSFDKNTLSKNSSVAILGFDDPKGKMAEELTYYKTVVQNELIYVFWTKINKLDEEIYAETFDVNLKRIKGLTKIATLDLPVDMKKSVVSKKTSSFIVLNNRKHGNSIVVGCEVPKKDDYLKFRYSILSGDLKLSDQKEVILPVKLSDVYFGIQGTYVCLENGDFITYSTFTTEKGKDNSDRIVNGAIKLSNLNLCGNLTYIKAKEGKSVSEELPYKSFYAPKLNYSLTKDNKFQFYGMYSDLTLDPKGNMMHGVFRYEIDLATLEKKELQLVPFEKTLLEKIYNAENDAKAYSTKFASIDTAITQEDGVVFLFGAQDMYGFNDLGFFVKIDNDNTIKWVADLRKEKLNARNIKLMSKDKELMIFYPVDSPFSAVSLTRKGSYTDYVGYCILNMDSGQFIKGKDKNLNDGSENFDTKFRSIQSFDHQLYLNYIDYKKGEGSIGFISF